MRHNGHPLASGLRPVPQESRYNLIIELRRKIINSYKRDTKCSNCFLPNIHQRQENSRQRGDKRITISVLYKEQGGEKCVQRNEEKRSKN